MNRKLLDMLLLVAAGVFSAWPATGRAATTRYVAAGGLHLAPFTTWETAATNIQSAINLSEPGDTVLVSNGTYRLRETLQITNHVSVRAPAGRDETLLDAGGLPAGTDAVFIQYGSLDGFTVSHAPRHGVKSEHGAIYNCRVIHAGENGIDSYTTPRIVTDSTLVVTNTIVQHSGHIGIFTCAVDTRIEDCAILESGDAGVSLRQNDTTGVIQLPRVSNFVLRASTISSNRNSGVVLAFYNYSAAFPDVPVRIEDCLIEANEGERGGGVADAGGAWGNGDSGVQITRSIIRGNTASIMGGGVFFSRYRSPTISHSLIEDNSSDGDGGGIYMRNGLMHNCLVRGNVSGRDGGGAFGGDIYQTTLLQNEAARYAGGAQNSVLRNSIIYYNTAPVDPNRRGGSAAYCCTWPHVGGAGNITDPPMLAGYRNARLVTGSPCIEAGDPRWIEGDFDYYGNPRVWGAAVDIGAHEFYPPELGGPLDIEIVSSTSRAVVGSTIAFQCNIEGKPGSYLWLFSDGVRISNMPLVEHTFDVPGEHTAMVTARNPETHASKTIQIQIYPGYTNYVSASGTHEPPFTQWHTAAHTIQDAIDENMPGGVVLVDSGTYNQGGASARGGLPSRVVTLEDMQVIGVNGPTNTVIVGRGPVGIDAIRCVYLAPGARLAGFTLTGGHTYADGEAERDQSGAGAWCHPGTVIENCIIQGNTAYEQGGGVRYGTIRDSLLVANSAWLGGGASGSTLSGCELRGNEALHGAGAYAAVIEQSVLSNNVALGEGGGAYASSLANTLIVHNHAAYGGGSARSTNLHVTLVHNQATLYGGGAYHGSAHNSILYYNSAGEGWNNYFNTICSYVCTTPDPLTVGNVTSPPLFMDTPGGDYRLSRASPAVDRALPSALQQDILGRPRAVPGTREAPPLPDMGAYELVPYLFVAPGGGDTWPYTSWADAAHDLQAAIDAADPTSHVLVSNAVFASGGRTHGGGLTNRVVIDKPISVIGVNGPSNTIIEGSGPVGEAAVRGVYLGSQAMLEGFTIRGGATRATGDPVHDQSGGGLLSEESGQVARCIITSCAAHLYGGGMYGGRMVNSFVHANEAAYGGGIAQGAVEFCTVVDNSAQTGGGVYLGKGAYSIIYFNTAPISPNVHAGEWESCCVTPNPGGPGHITSDPLLLALDDYRLSADSPCIDAIADTPPCPGGDLDGIPRPLDGNNNQDARYDIGAHEFIHPTADTDGDGLSDYEEIFIYGTDPTLWDTDGDGMSDGAEIIAGTDPLDSNSVFALTVTESTPEQQVFTWPSSEGRLYTMYRTETMTLTMTNLPHFTDIPGENGYMVYTNPAPLPRSFHVIGVRLAP